MATTNSSIRVRWAAIGAAVAVSLGAAGVGLHNVASADVSSGDRPIFVSITPCRLTDTRPAPNTVGPRSGGLAAAETLTITARGENGRCTGTSMIPADAVALSLNVTALGATQQTFLALWGDGANPGTANLNPAPDQPPTPNAVNTPLSAAGTFNVFNERGNVNVVIDVNGYYASHNHDDRYYTEAETYSRAEADARTYTKAEVDARTYTKAEVDARTYTKAEADARTYTKAEVDAIIAGLTPKEIVLGPQAFTAEDPGSDKWTGVSTLFHGASADSECIDAPLPLQVGQTLDDVVIVVSVPGGGAFDVKVQALTSEPGLFNADTVITVFDETTNSDPIAGRAVDYLLFFNGTHTVVAGYTYSIEICSKVTLEILAVKAILE